MNRRGWAWGMGIFLILLLGFALAPERFLRPAAPGPTQPMGTVPVLPALPGREIPVRSVVVAKTSPPDPVVAELETDAGKEVPGEKLVRFGSTEAYRKFLEIAPPGGVLGRIDALNAVRVKAGEWLSPFLAQTGGTLSGNFYVRIPEVPLEVREKGDAYYQAVGKKALELIGADGVTPSWGQGMKVALMDTPLEGMETTASENAGHGTAMRSLIQGSSGPARGAAPGAEVLGFAVLNSEGKGSSFDLAQAIVKATDQGVRVINMSLGSEGDSPVVRDAVAYALQRNVVLVAAAGNEAVNRVSYPAAYEGVIGVASVDARANHLYFSNRGKSVDVAAPGFAVVAAWPGGKNAEITGTSASAALVSGAVAALLSREPGLTGKQATELMGQYADATGLPGTVEETGSGVINLGRILERNRRGLVDVAVGGVTMKEEGSKGRVFVGIQNRGTETVNSPVLEVTAGNERRRFFFGSLAPGQTMAESMMFDLARARAEGGIGAGAAVSVRADQRSENDLWSGYFRVSKEK